MKRFVVIVLACMAIFCGMGDAYASAGNSSAEIQAPAKKSELKVVVFDSKLHCENCVKKVKENISFEKGVKGLEVSLEQNTIKITYDPQKTNEETLAKAIRKLGYPVVKRQE